VSGGARTHALLILGGTTEARELAATLEGRHDLRVITSLAGRVADRPSLPGEIRIGGFGGPERLAEWLTANEIRVVVDATHPFAERISRGTADACAATGTPLIALRRPGWTAGPGDDWRPAADLADAAGQVTGLGERVLLATGRQGVAAFAGVAGAWFLIRAIEAPTGPLPPHHRLLLARGPYTLSGERRLLDEHAIDLVVTKDSGGDATRAKLDAARERGIPVLMVCQPPLPVGQGIETVDTLADAATAVDASVR
jgi:precorrin-6A/cobalt-precorrin-6A reductase